MSANLPPANSLEPPALITVLVRSASARRLPMLELALASLARQSWTGIEVLVMVQSPDAGFTAGVEAAISRIAWPATTTARAIAVSVEPGVDGRSQLMNAGVAVATGRYLAFLDDDDIVYPQAYARLIGRLRDNPAAVMAAGGCELVRVVQTEAGMQMIGPAPPPFGRDHVKFDLLIGNFIPIHSYIVDLARFPRGSVIFRDEAVPLEDYDFLLRLAAGGAFDLSLTDEMICEYRLHDGNTIWSPEGTPIPGRPVVQRAAALLEGVASTTAFTVTRAEWLEAVAREGRAAAAPQARRACAAAAPDSRFLHRRADDAYRLMEATGPLYRGLARLYMALQGWRRG